MLKMRKKLPMFLIATALSVLLSCSNDQDIIEVDALVQQNENVFKTYNKDLPANVIKIESIKSTHPALSESSLISSRSFINNKSQSSENGIYYYSNDSKATMSYLNSIVYATITDSKGVEIENIIADFSKVKSEGIVTIDYIETGKTEIININSSNKSWGSCMDGAIDELYDDWEESPAGTMSCWLTGPLCAIGGGIACGIKQI